MEPGDTGGRVSGLNAVIEFIGNWNCVVKVNGIPALNKLGPGKLGVNGVIGIIIFGVVGIIGASLLDGRGDTSVKLPPESNGVRIIFGEFSASGHSDIGIIHPPDDKNRFIRSCFLSTGVTSPPHIEKEGFTSCADVRSILTELLGGLDKSPSLLV